MPGAREAHHLISANFLTGLRIRTRGFGPRVYPSDMRVRAGSGTFYTYPDVVVAIETPILADEELDTLLNPGVVVEVLSESTASSDRGKKFALYRQVPSLRDYVLVWQDEPRGECHSRDGESWSAVVFSGLDSSVRIPSLGCEIPLSELDEDVEFPPS